LGLSDHDRVNLFYAKPIIMLAEMYDVGTYVTEPGTCPILTDASFHGEKVLVKESAFMTDFTTPKVDLGETTSLKDDTQIYAPKGVTYYVKLKSHLLYDWFKDNPTYESGQITLQGDPAVRIGMRFYDARIKSEYFIVGVEHHFTFDANRNTTTVTVARGMPLAYA
jgi:hypothetical protein